MENNFSTEQEELIKLIDGKEKMVAMVAPSFPVDFSHCNLLGMLKRLGFDKLFEVTRGAIETNNQLLDLMNKNEKIEIAINAMFTLYAAVKLTAQMNPAIAGPTMDATCQTVLFHVAALVYKSRETNCDMNEGKEAEINPRTIPVNPITIKIGMVPCC